MSRRVLFSVAGLLCSFAIGLALVRLPMLALVVAASTAFALAWVTAPWLILVVPAAWYLVADPVLLGQGLGGSIGVLYQATDLWFGLCMLAVVLECLRSPALLRGLLREPAAIGIGAIWAAFAMTLLTHSGALPTSGLPLSEFRAVAYLGWFFVAAVVVRLGSQRGVVAVMATVAALVPVKAVIYWVLGWGLLDAGSLGGYRVFGSEEAAVGLIALSVGVALYRGSADRRVPSALTILGGAIVTVAALRAYWLAGVGIVLWLVVGEALKTPERAVRRTVGLLAPVAAIALWLMTFGRNFYEASVADRIESLFAGSSAASADPSLAYRVVEMGTVTASVGRHWLLGNGFGATHRGVLIWNPASTALQSSLAAYVHNSFLWAYLKAGAAGVFSVALYSIGLLLSAWRHHRSSSSLGVQSIGLGLTVAAGGLLFVSLFNAHIGSARYALAIALVWGSYLGLPNENGETVGE